MWKLVIEDDEGKRTVVPLTRDDYSIGRKEGNTIRLTERNVSRDHAKLRKKNGAAGPPIFALEDCTSYNGVYVNGLRVAQTHDLTHGDLIQIGDYRIVLQDDAITDQSSPPLVPDDMKATIPHGVSGAVSATTRGSLLLERPNRLVMLAGPTPGAEYPLNQERMTVGRAEDATISINHNSVSRLHCEIHSLGEGRYEIVDKGSSNGVRVNSSDLRRGIIEAGDIIELGDVKFKFVGAGQIFLPGVNDSQQLESIGDRAGTAASTRRSNSSLVPFIFLGALAAAIMVGGWAFKRQHALKNDRAQDVTASPEDIERSVLTEAKRICDIGRCEEAHDRIMTIASGSALRESDDFRLIEVAWANAMLERAEQETDLQKKKAILHQIERTETVDATRRKQANERLQAIDKEEQAAVQTPPHPLAAKDSGLRVVPTSPATAPPTRVPPPDTTTAPTHTTPKPVPVPASGSVYEEARTLMLTNPDAAKQKLLKRFVSGTANRDELCLLRTICKNPPRDMVLKEDVQKKLAEKSWACE